MNVRRQNRRDAAAVQRHAGRLSLPENRKPARRIHRWASRIRRRPDHTLVGEWASNIIEQLSRVDGDAAKVERIRSAAVSIREREAAPPDPERSVVIGAWLHELPVLPHRDVARLTSDFLGHGLDAIGVALYAPENGEPVPTFDGNDLSRPSDGWRRNMDAIVGACSEAGAELWAWGWSFPASRRKYPFGLLYRGRQIPDADCWLWRDEIVGPWLEFVAWVREEYGDTMQMVDSIEPFGPNLPHPPNRVTDQIQGVWPGAYRAGVDEVHPDPGGELLTARVVSFDGWGRNSVEWPVPDGRRLRYAALPPGGKNDVVAWFEEATLASARAGAEAVFVLHTTTWSAYDYASAKDSALQRPGVREVNVAPWDALYERLGRLTVPEAEAPAPDAVDLSGAVVAGNSHEEISSFARTSAIVDVDVSPSRIRISHSKASEWPDVRGVNANPWVGAWIDGELHVGTFEWARPGQSEWTLHVPDESPSTREALGPHVKSGPLETWFPRRGERVLLFVSSLARLGEETVNERTPVVEIEWPF